MEIIEKDFSVEIINENKKYLYNKPMYKGYDYIYLTKKLCELNITKARIGIKTCNIVSNNKILTKLKKIFGENVSFTGSYKDKIYQYNIVLLNDEDYLNFKKINGELNIK